MLCRPIHRPTSPPAFARQVTPAAAVAFVRQYVAFFSDACSSAMRVLQHASAHHGASPFPTGARCRRPAAAARAQPRAACTRPIRRRVVPPETSRATWFRGASDGVRLRLIATWFRGALHRPVPTAVMQVLQHASAHHGASPFPAGALHRPVPTAVNLRDAAWDGARR
jgi:hypothetical protein